MNIRPLINVKSGFLLIILIYKMTEGHHFILLITIKGQMSYCFKIALLFMIGKGNSSYFISFAIKKNNIRCISIGSSLEFLPIKTWGRCCFRIRQTNT